MAANLDNVHGQNQQKYTDINLDQRRIQSIDQRLCRCLIVDCPSNVIYRVIIFCKNIFKKQLTIMIIHYLVYYHYYYDDA